MADAVELQLIAEKTLQHPANSELLAYCPSMELLAVGSTDQNILIYRLNGQRVFGAGQKVKGAVLDVQKLVWKPNGQLLAIAWSDGTIRLLGAESNKTVHQIVVSEGGDADVTCISWSSYSTASESLESILSKAEPRWKDAAQGGMKEKGAQPLDLPRDLASIDIESSLPKLSVLPSGGTTEDIFSSRASLDALFRPFDPKDNDSVDVMVVGTSDGRIHLSIFDSFVVGSFPSPLKASKTSSHQLILHASHRNYSMHGLLMKSTSTLVGGLYFVPMDLRFVTASSSYLSLLASRSSALQNLLRYIHQVQTLMTAEWQATQDLPSRFLRNIDETLAEHGDWTIVPALYHQVVTGHTLPDVKVWLVDELAERGHKRWDKAVSAGLASLIRLTHEHLLPALERAALILSRLFGLAAYHSTSSHLGFSPQQIKLLLDTIASLNLAATRILTTTITSLELFTSFSAWLRAEIDRLASGSPLPDNPEATDLPPPTTKILEYIQTSLTTSPLSPFFTPITPEAQSAQWDTLGTSTPIFDALATALNKPDPTNPVHASLPNIAALCAHLDDQAHTVFSGIAAAEKRNVLFGDPVPVAVVGADADADAAGGGKIAMRMVPIDEARSATYIASSSTSSEGDAVVRVQRVEITTETGVSRAVSTRVASIGPPGVKGASVRDLAFLDDETLLVLLSGLGGGDGGEAGGSIILALRFRDAEVEYRDVQGGGGGGVGGVRTVVQRLGGMKYRIAANTSFEPEKMSVGAAEDGGRIVVLARGALRYRVFTMGEGSVLRRAAGEAGMEVEMEMES